MAGRGWHELDPAQQDVVYLALRLSAFEIAAVKNPAPFFCERVTEIAHLPLETYAPFLKFLAKRAQVFVLCRDAAEAAGIEQVVTIG